VLGSIGRLAAASRWGACYHHLFLPDQPLIEAFADALLQNVMTGLRPGPPDR